MSWWFQIGDDEGEALQESRKGCTSGSDEPHVFLKCSKCGSECYVPKRIKPVVCEFCRDWESKNLKPYFERCK